jgi:hypothetical protein
MANNSGSHNIWNHQNEGTFLPDYENTRYPSLRPCCVLVTALQSFVMKRLSIVKYIPHLSS